MRACSCPVLGELIFIRGTEKSRATTILLRGANEFMLDEMDRSLHDVLCVVKRVLESKSLVRSAAWGCRPFCCAGGHSPPPPLLSCLAFPCLSFPSLPFSHARG